MIIESNKVQLKPVCPDFGNAMLAIALFGQPYKTNKIMGYSFYLISKEKEISQKDFNTAMTNLSKFNRKGYAGMPFCDIDFKKHYIRVSGSFGVSGQYAEGFVLNLLMCLLDLNYKPKVISHDWEYGTKEDWEWLDGVR